MSIEPDQNEDSAQKIPVTQQLEAMISKHPYKLSIRPKNEGNVSKLKVLLPALSPVRFRRTILAFFELFSCLLPSQNRSSLVHAGLTFL